MGADPADLCEGGGEGVEEGLGRSGGVGRGWGGGWRSCCCCCCCCLGSGGVGGGSSSLLNVALPTSVFSLTGFTEL